MERLETHLSAARAMPEEFAPEEFAPEALGRNEVSPQPPPSQPSARHLALARVRRRRSDRDPPESGSAFEEDEADAEYSSRSSSLTGSNEDFQFLDEPSRASRPSASKDSLRPARPLAPAGGSSVISAVRNIRNNEEDRLRRLARVEAESLKREQCLGATSPPSGSSASETLEEELGKARASPGELVMAEVASSEDQDEVAAEAAAEMLLLQRLRQRHSARAAPQACSAPPSLEEAVVQELPENVPRGLLNSEDTFSDAEDHLCLEEEMGYASLFPRPEERSKVHGRDAE
ncbi:unnamed protein product, partial [Polarella glacialis]